MRNRGREAFRERLRAAFSALDAGDERGEAVVEIAPALVDRARREQAHCGRRAWMSQRLAAVYAHRLFGGPARIVYRSLFRRR